MDNVAGGGLPVAILPNVEPVFADGNAEGSADAPLHCGVPEQAISDALTAAWSLIVANLDLVEYATCVTTWFDGVQLTRPTGSEAGDRAYMQLVFDPLLAQVRSQVPPRIRVTLDERQFIAGETASGLSPIRRAEICGRSVSYNGDYDGADGGFLVLTIGQDSSLALAAADVLLGLEPGSSRGVRLLAGTILHELVHAFDGEQRLYDGGFVRSYCTPPYLVDALFRAGVCFRYTGAECA